MRHLNRRSTQSGVVLVIGLLLLLIITIVAVASMSSTHMQERMAGNARTQALAFEVASAGASDSLEFYHTNLDEVPMTNCSDPKDWDEYAFSPEPERQPDIGPHRVQLTRHLYCLNAPLRPQYFVLSIGEVLAADGATVIARRAVEVRVARMGDDADCGALCFLGCATGTQYRFPTSMSFEVDGDTNPAITVPEECRQEVRDAIRDNVIGNYEGGISGYVEPLPPPWTTPDTVDAFRRELLETMLGGVTLAGPSLLLDTYESPPPSSSSSVSTIGTSTNYSWEFIQPPTDGPNTGTHVIAQGSSAQYGTRENPQITYIAGDADMRGGVTGAGILVVEGNLEWRGTPPFEGLILVLGGKYKVGGGGTGGNFAGSLVVVNIWDEHDPNNRNAGYYSHWYDKGGLNYLSGDFGKTDLDFRGGGTALYQYDCGYLQDLAEKLPETGTWDPQCGGAESGETLERIVSWRESIGWRVDFVD